MFIAVTRKLSGDNIAFFVAPKYTAVFSYFYFLFGPEPIYQRVSKGDVTILITTLNLYERKVKQLVERLPSLRYIIHGCSRTSVRQILSFSTLMEQASTDFKIPETNPEDAALLHFTSGTGMPKAFYMCIMLFYPLRNR
jgi:acetyl-CoA synthetase